MGPRKMHQYFFFPGKLFLWNKENCIMTKLSNSTFLIAFLKLAPSGIKLVLFYTCGKPLVLKNANFMPSGTILKVLQKSLIYIFAMKYHLIYFSNSHAFNQSNFSSHCEQPFFLITFKKP